MSENVDADIQAFMDDLDRRKQVALAEMEGGPVGGDSQQTASEVQQSTASLNNPFEDPRFQLQSFRDLRSASQRDLATAAATTTAVGGTSSQRDRPQRGLRGSQPDLRGSQSNLRGSQTDLRDNLRQLPSQTTLVPNRKDLQEAWTPAMEAKIQLQDLLPAKETSTEDDWEPTRESAAMPGVPPQVATSAAILANAKAAAPSDRTGRSVERTNFNYSGPGNIVAPVMFSANPRDISTDRLKKTGRWESEKLMSSAPVESTTTPPKLDEFMRCLQEDIQKQVAKDIHRESTIRTMFEDAPPVEEQLLQELQRQASARDPNQTDLDIERFLAGTNLPTSTLSEAEPPQKDVFAAEKSFIERELKQAQGPTVDALAEEFERLFEKRLPDQLEKMDISEALSSQLPPPIAQPAPTVACEYEKSFDLDLLSPVHNHVVIGDFRESLRKSQILHQPGAHGT